MSEAVVNNEAGGLFDYEEITSIKVKGAREHNLKNVSLEIPRDKLIVITGLSGSGKSSLAFDTLYAEGQRRYVECLSPYARQYMGIMKKPDVDSIEGLSPAISIEQKSLSHNPRSTVGTVTEIYDYLRLLYAKIGVQHCVDCHVPVKQKTIDQIIDEIFEKHEGKKAQILSPLVHGRKGHYRELFEQLIKQGFTRVRIDGEIKQLVDGMQLDRYKIHNIELVVDRTKIEKQSVQRIAESAELALRKGDGTMTLLTESASGEWEDELLSVLYSCPSCGKSYEPLAPNMFSFNSPYGACPKCEGLGEISDFNPTLLITDKDLTLEAGAIGAIGKRKKGAWLWAQAEAAAEAMELPLDKPVRELDKDKLNALLFGNEEKIEVEYKFGERKMKYKHTFPGIIPSLRHLYEATGRLSVQKKLDSFMSSEKCPVCEGGRLKIENLNVLVDGKNIFDVATMDISHALDYYSSLEPRLNERDKIISKLILKEIHSRLEFLKDVGLSYLNLSRSVRTLSGGESQRIRLASQIGSKLVGIMYVLDEPSIGLHQHDNNKLIASLKKLRDMGNTVIVVEHDKAMIEEADYIVDIGPGAGVHGGEIIITTEPAELKTGASDGSLTAKYITGEIDIEISSKRRAGNGKKLILHGAKGNNLKDVTLELPLAKSICITGMSGSGKSSLVNDTLYPILSRRFYKSNDVPLEYDRLEGIENIDKIIEIDQSPIGRTPRSNPATYTGLFTLIRDFYALLPESKVRGYKAGRFSFNVAGGRCEECQGAGIKKIEMNFLPDVYVNCDICDGKRYNSETLQVKYKNKSISEALEMTVEEALDFFSEIPKIRKKMNALFEVGLGYIKLGQQAPTLSGGEAQRVKLATELSKTSTGNTLYLLDEPTTGLHFEDIRILLKLLDRLVDKGNTVVIIEHNLDVIKSCDWIIDMGPEGGEKGGMIIAQGTPEEVAANKESLTGFYLKEEL